MNGKPFINYLCLYFNTVPSVAGASAAHPHVCKNNYEIQLPLVFNGFTQLETVTLLLLFDFVTVMV